MGIKQKVIKRIKVLANKAVSATRIKQLQKPCCIGGISEFLG
ncbi:Protein of unknown function [Bacillus cereus]|nr:Protein of unknown function [Bacillus cereus]